VAALGVYAWRLVLAGDDLQRFVVESAAAVVQGSAQRRRRRRWRGGGRVEL
jgi:hypothetical protein